MVGAGGLVISIVAVAVGAILDWAVTVSPYQHGFNVNKIGVILMIVGVVGAVLSIVAMAFGTLAAVGLSWTTDGERCPSGRFHVLTRTPAQKALSLTGR